MLKNFLIRLVVNALALSAAAWMLGGIRLEGDFVGILIVALVFGILNAVLKPILILFSLPVLVLTLGLFALVVNAVVLLVTASLTEALDVDGFWWALLGSVIVSFVTLVLGGLLDDEIKR